MRCHLNMPMTGKVVSSIAVCIASTASRPGADEREVRRGAAESWASLASMKVPSRTPMPISVEQRDHERREDRPFQVRL